MGKDKKQVKSQVLNNGNLKDNGYNREIDLENQLDDFFSKFGVENLYGKLSGNDFINLKQMLSCVNNIITLKATQKFVDILYKDKIILRPDLEKILEKILGQHANTNGYDVQYDGGPKIIAEVKCNIPVNGDSFGASQKKGINKDIKNLFEGKIKANLPYPTKEYIKFLVILECENAKVCMDKIIDPINKNRQDGQVLYYDTIHDKNNLPSGNVYVVFVTIDNDK